MLINVNKMHKEEMRFLHFTTQLTPAVYLSVRKQWGAKMDLVALNKNTMVTITGKNIHSEFFPRWCWLLVYLMWIYATVLKVTNINFLPLSPRNIMIIITLPILKSDKNNTFFCSLYFSCDDSSSDVKKFRWWLWWEKRLLTITTQ